MGKNPLKSPQKYLSIFVHNLKYKDYAQCSIKSN